MELFDKFFVFLFYVFVSDCCKVCFFCFFECFFVVGVELELDYFCIFFYCLFYVVYSEFWFNEEVNDFNFIWDVKNVRIVFFFENFIVVWVYGIDFIVVFEEIVYDFVSIVFWFW